MKEDKMKKKKYPIETCGFALAYLINNLIGEK